MNVPSYTTITFIVKDSEARVRADDLTSLKYKAGDVIPPNKKTGDFKIIPKGTEISVTDTKTDNNRNLYVLVKAAAPNPEIPSGWTMATNLDGKFVNELISYSPDDWDLPPQGNNFTVTDAEAYIRTGAPDFKPTGVNIPKGTYVVISDWIGKFGKISQGSLVNDQIKTGKEIGWTALSNLTDGWSKFFSTDSWANKKGPNACWEKGNYIGSKVLVNIIGVGTVIKQITLDSAENYFKLQSAAAAKKLDLQVTSGFRTFAKQAQLYEIYQNGGNNAALPGRSDHQHGQAFDLNSQDTGSELYKWMTKNAPDFGFIRTVNGEPWHWEYRPVQAKALAAKGSFKLDNVFT